MRALMHLALLVSLLVAGCLATGAWFAEGTLQRAHLNAVESRFNITLDRIASSAENAAALGISLPMQARLPYILMDERTQDPDIDWISVVDASHQMLFQDGVAHNSNADRVLNHAIHDDLGLMIGQVQLHYTPDATTQPALVIHQTIQRLTVTLLIATTLATSALIILGGAGTIWPRISQHSTPTGISMRYARLGLLVGVLLILVIGFASIGWQARSLIDQIVAPAMSAKAETIGHGAQALITKALTTGIPLNALEGVEPYFQQLQQRYPEISGLALRTAEQTLHTIGVLDNAQAFSIRHGGQKIAELLISVDAARATRQIHGILLDIAFLGIAALLIGSELWAMSSKHWRLRPLEPVPAYSQPTLAAAQDPAAHVRAALFVFMLAEELTRPFLPGFTQGLLPASITAHIDLLVSLPIVVFMAIVALCQLPFATWSESLGRRRGFMLGAFCAALGYAASALTDRYDIFLIARALSAAGFALVFVSAQGHILDHGTQSGRTGSFAIFVRTILIAALCAPPIGGFIADHLGASSAFMGSAVLSVLAMALAGMHLTTYRTNAVRAQLNCNTVLSAWRTPGLRALLLGCAIPAKLVLTALCFYMVPVMLMAQGYSNADIGRIQMIYPLVMVLGVPAFALIADGENCTDRRVQCVVWGGLVVGTGALLAAVTPSLPMIAAFLLLLGLGQALSIAPQSSLVATHAHQASDVSTAASILGLFRLTERAGAAAGPALAGLLLGVVGFGPTIALFGLCTAMGALGYRNSLRHPSAIPLVDTRHDSTTR